MPGFFETEMGRRFYQGTFPQLARGVEEQSKNIEALTKEVKKLTELLMDMNNREEYVKAIVSPDQYAEKDIQDELNKGPGIRVEKMVMSQEVLHVVFSRPAKKQPEDEKKGSEESE